MATTKTNGGAAPKAIGAGVRALESDTRELLGALEQLTASAGDALREQMDQRPYVAIGAGFLAGYVLGGGLSIRLATFLAAGAARVTAAQLIARGLAGSTPTRAGGRAS